MSLATIFSHSTWQLHHVATCREAVKFARAHETPVVISERRLPDGDWKSLLNELEKLRSCPRLIVTSRFADDELWAEVLNLGGYDVLAQPFDREEVHRVVHLAWHHSRGKAPERGQPFRPELV